MAQKRDRKGLGRGLSALMADIEPVATETPTAIDLGTETSEIAGPAARADRLVPVDRIVPNPDQPRRSFDEEALTELAASLRQKGVIQPLIVRPDPADASMYQIVAGERRWRAAQRAQIHELPVIVRAFDDTEVLEIAIIENIQRADLNPIEEAQGYRQLMDRFGHTQEQLSEALGKSRSHIANQIRLLQLPDDVIDLVTTGKLSAGHARALITTPDPLALARKAVARGLSVREVERLAKASSAPPDGKSTSIRSPRAKDADTRILEQDLSAVLGMSVVIDHDVATGGGKLTIKYNDLSGLDDLMRVLNGG